LLTAGEMCNTEKIFAGQQLIRELRIGDIVLKLPGLLEWYVDFTRALEREGSHRPFGHRHEIALVRWRQRSPGRGGDVGARVVAVCGGGVHAACAPHRR
jgi:hypothetical protein